MCSCQDCNTRISRTPNCPECVQISDLLGHDGNVTEYHKLFPNVDWNCKYCKNELINIGGLSKNVSAPPNLNDVLEDIAKLKRKLSVLLYDMDQVKTDLIDLKATTNSTHTYMMGVNGKVKRLEDRIVKLDKNSSSFFAIRQTIVKFENDIGGSKQSLCAQNDKSYGSMKEIQLYPKVMTKDVLVKDQNSFMAKVQSRLRNAPKLLLSTFKTNEDKKISLLRCEV